MEPSVFNTFSINQNIQTNSIVFDVGQLGKKTQLPEGNRNYCIFNMPLVERLVKNSDKTIPLIEKKILETKDEKVIAEGLYTFDRMIDAGKFDIKKTYSTLAKLNDTKSPTVQVLLAGIYRKTQLPDAFGPLNKMLIQDSINPPVANFDPTEEIGGAILEYIRNASAQKAYGTNFASNKKFTDRQALQLLKAELTNGMPEKEANDWVNKIKQTCEKFNIQPKNLPINEEHPGALTDKQNSNIFTEILYSVFNDNLSSKTTLLPN